MLSQVTKEGLIILEMNMCDKLYPIPSKQDNMTDTPDMNLGQAM